MAGSKGLNHKGHKGHKGEKKQRRESKPGVAVAVFFSSMLFGEREQQDACP
jgi:hypothetical protein